MYGAVIVIVASCADALRARHAFPRHVREECVTIRAPALEAIVNGICMLALGLNRY